MLADHHAVAVEAGQRARRHPAQAERGGVAAERVVGCQRACDECGVLRHALVDRLAPVAVRPAVEAAVAHRREVVGRRLVAQAVAFVHHGPEPAGQRLPGHADGVAQSGGEDAAVLRAQVQFVDAGAAFFGFEAVFGDVAQRADADVEALAVAAGQQAARPVPAGLEAGEAAPRRGDARRARRVGEGQHAVGVADVEGVAEQRHAEGLVEVLEQGVALLGHAVAVGIAQQRDAVGALAERGGAAHGGAHRMVEQRARCAAGLLQRLGHGDVAVGQHVDPARMLQPGGEGVDLQAGRGTRHLPGGPALRGGHLQRRDAALRQRGRDLRRRAHGRRALHLPLQAAPTDRRCAHQGHGACERVVKGHACPRRAGAHCGGEGSSRAVRCARALSPRPPATLTPHAAPALT